MDAENECFEKAPSHGEQFDKHRLRLLDARHNAELARRRLRQAEEDLTFCEVIVAGRQEELNRLLRQAGVKDGY